MPHIPSTFCLFNSHWASLFIRFSVGSVSSFDEFRKDYTFLGVQRIHCMLVILRIGRSMRKFSILQIYWTGYWNYRYQVPIIKYIYICFSNRLIFSEKWHLIFQKRKLVWCALCLTSDGVILLTEYPNQHEVCTFN